MRCEAARVVAAWLGADRAIETEALESVRRVSGCRCSVIYQPGREAGHPRTRVPTLSHLGAPTRRNWFPTCPEGMLADFQPSVIESDVELVVSEGPLPLHRVLPMPFAGCLPLADTESRKCRATNDHTFQDEVIAGAKHEQLGAVKLRFGDLHLGS